VGENGTVIALQAVSVRLFTRGITTTEIQFDGATDDPAPTALTPITDGVRTRPSRQLLHQ
jgi:hypothetical protein